MSKRLARKVNELDNVPWPVLLFLGMRSRKYIETTKALPQMGRIGAAVRDTKHRLLWRGLLGGPQSGYDPPWWKDKRRGRQVSACNAVHVPPEFKAYAAEFECVMDQSLRRCSSQSSAARLCTISLSQKFTLRWFARHEIAPVPTDKDGGFALVHYSDLLRMYHEQIVEPKYTEV
eukprot:3952116-Karenia_brevis.AAC.1